MLLRILETAWLLIALTCASLAIYNTVAKGFAYDAMWMTGMTVVASVMYAVRRKQRIKLSREGKEK